MTNENTKPQYDNDPSSLRECAKQNRSNLVLLQKNTNFYFVIASEYKRAWQSVASLENKAKPKFI